jgi:hypothetical protein
MISVMVSAAMLLSVAQAHSPPEMSGQKHISSAARRCYEQALTSAPDLAGRVTFEIEGFAGRLIVLEAHDQVGSPELIACLCRRLVRPLERALLSKESEAPETISFPFIFQSGSGEAALSSREPSVTRCALYSPPDASVELPSGAVVVRVEADSPGLQAAVLSAVAGRQEALEHCYRQDRVRWPEQAGTGTLWLAVAPGGEVLFTGMSAEGLRHAETLSCLRVVLEAMVVPGADGAATVTLELSIPPE